MTILQRIQHLPGWLALIGRCYEATGRNQEAVIYYRQALALDKNFTEAADGIKRLQ